MNRMTGYSFEFRMLNLSRVSHDGSISSDEPVVASNFPIIYAQICKKCTFKIFANYLWGRFGFRSILLIKALLTVLFLYACSFSLSRRGNYSVNEKTAHFASWDIFHNHSVRGPEIRREIVTDRRYRYLFCLHTISLVRYNCTVWSGASHNCPPLFARRPRRKTRIKEEKKTGRSCVDTNDLVHPPRYPGYRSQLVFDSLIWSTRISIGSANQPRS